MTELYTLNFCELCGNKNLNYVPFGTCHGPCLRDRAEAISLGGFGLSHRRDGIRWYTLGRKTDDTFSVLPPDVTLLVQTWAGYLLWSLLCPCACPGVPSVIPAVCRDPIQCEGGWLGLSTEPAWVFYFGGLNLTWPLCPQGKTRV